MPPSRVVTDSQDVIGTLPVWCQVAFAARAARRARHKLLHRKPETPTDRLGLLDRLIDSIKQTAADGRVDVNTMARAASEAGKIARGVSDSTRATSAVSAVSLAADCARSAAFAPDAPPASGPPFEYTSLARQAAVAAHKAGVDENDLQEDLNLLIVGTREFSLGYLDPPPATLFLFYPDDTEPAPTNGPAGVVVRFDADTANATDVGLVFDLLSATYRSLGGSGLRLVESAEWPQPTPPEPTSAQATAAAEPPPPTPWPAGGLTVALSDLHGSHGALLSDVPLLLDRVNAFLPESSPVGGRAWKLIGCDLPTALPLPDDLRDTAADFAKYEAERGELLLAVRGPLPNGGAPGEDTVVNVSALNDTVQDIPSGPRILPERVARLATAADRHRRRSAEKLALRRVELAAVSDTDGVLRVLVARRPPSSSSARPVPPPPPPPPARPTWRA